MNHHLWSKVEKLESEIYLDYQVKEIGVDLKDESYSRQKAFWSGALYALNDLKKKRETIKQEVTRYAETSDEKDG